MDFAKTLLFLVFAMWAVLGYAAFRDTSAPPAKHPSMPAMEVGGERAEADRELLVPGAIFALLCFGLLLLGLALGADVRRQRSIAPLLVMLAIPVLFVVVGIFAIEMKSTDSSTDRFWGGFPLSTALVIYGVWAVPTLYCWVYGVGYERWFAVDAPRLPANAREEA